MVDIRFIYFQMWHLHYFLDTRTSDCTKMQFSSQKSNKNLINVLENIRHMPSASKLCLLELIQFAVYNSFGKLN